MGRASGALPKTRAYQFSARATSDTVQLPSIPVNIALAPLAATYQRLFNHSTTARRQVQELGRSASE
ncbi:hypothetical protein [Glutamicibacter sp. HZAU]|uniref:hypothetical protein n=1 Tax=Glutamicibacter sp. HZAU TaxID=2049891 RepID=UPI001F2AE5EE|nr:hypothetical protein [Glutamicibacter sp. HZAU]